MTPLANHRDDGPLARVVPRGRVPVPELVLVVIGVAAALAPALGDLAPVAGVPWAWTLVGVAVAVAGRSGRPLRQLDWCVPALLRALEYGSVVLLVGASPVTYALLATLAFRHYDIVYRERTRGDGPPPWLAAATGGWELRTALLAAAASVDAAAAAALAMTFALVPVLAVETIMSWRRSATAADR